MFINEYPYTDFHELNLDWVLTKIKKLEDKYDNTLTAELKAFIESKFNDIFADVAYDSTNKRLILSLTSVEVSGAEHIYTANNETMTII